MEILHQKDILISAYFRSKNRFQILTPSDRSILLALMNVNLSILKNNIARQKKIKQEEQVNAKLDPNPDVNLFMCCSQKS